MKRPNFLSSLTLNITPPELKKSTELSVEELLHNSIKTPEILDIAMEIATNITQESTYIKNVIDKINNSNNRPISLHKNRIFEESVETRYYVDIYVYSDDDDIIKIYLYDCDNLSDYLLIKEVAMQIYSERIVGPKCDYGVPRIISYGKHILNETDNIDTSKTCLFFIKMKKILYNNLYNFVKSEEYNETNCDEISTKINTISTCMKLNNLYHNDLHRENIMIDKYNNISIIDYGRATDNPLKLLTPLETYSCERLENIKKIGGNKSKKRRLLQPKINKKSKKRGKNRGNKKSKKYVKR